jgi:biopolymer transport protein TolR
MAMQLGGASRTMSEINVTPMVDVMLVLLIIFMVTAPLIQQGVAVELPQTKAQALDVQENRLVLTLTAQKRVFLGDVEIPYAELRDKLVGNIRLRNDKQIYLHADRNLAYGFVVDVMATMKDAGVENLGMVTDPMTKNALPGR